MARIRTYEQLVECAYDRCTQAQAERLRQYLAAGWKVTKVDGLQGYDSVVCIAMQRTPATIDPTGLVTRASVGLKTVSYKFPRTNIRAEEIRQAQEA